jgi:hypothetical protein
MKMLLLLLIPTLWAQTPFVPGMTKSEIRKAVKTYSKKVNPCPKTNELNGELLIVVEGANGYSPRREKIIRSINEQVKCHQYYSTMSNVFFYSRLMTADLYDVFHEVEKLTKRSGSTGALSFLLAENVLTIDDNRTWVYFAQSHGKKIQACINKHEQAIRDGEVKLKFLSYSWGAGTSYKIIRDLEKRGIEVNSVLSVDPVIKDKRVLGNVLGSGEHEYFEKPSNVIHWDNVYQTQSHNGFLGAIKVRGSKVLGANNFHIKYDVEEKRTDYHSMIPMHSSAYYLTKKFLKQ